MMVYGLITFAANIATSHSMHEPTQITYIFCSHIPVNFKLRDHSCSAANSSKAAAEGSFSLQSANSDQKFHPTLQLQHNRYLSEHLAMVSS